MKKFVIFMLAALLLVTMAPSAFSADSSAKTPPEDTNEKVLSWKAYNGDTIGWLYIPDTKINNVVVQFTGDYNQYYLRRNAKKEYSFDGCYFADYRCDFSGGGLPNNTVIYGQSLSDKPNGKKFDQLKKYLDDDFAAEHPYIYFSNGNKIYAFKVFAVFIADVRDVDMPYNVPTIDDKTRQKVFKIAKESSVREYKSQPGPNAKLLTLSTATYSDKDGKPLSFPNDFRYAVMAYAVKPPDPKQASK